MGELFVSGVEMKSEDTTKVLSKSQSEKKEEVRVAVKKAKNRTEKIVYSHEEAVDASCLYFNGDELAARVWANKYALKDSFGNLFEKTPDDMHRRLASEIHRVEMKYNNPLSEELIYNVLK